MIKFINKINNVYQFEIYEDNKLIHTINIEANSKEDAMSKIKTFTSLRNQDSELDFQKNNLINLVKVNASRLLKITDFKAIRHRDEVDMGVTTSITNDEYKTILATRKKIRDKSNELESEINSINTISDLKLFQIDPLLGLTDII